MQRADQLAGDVEAAYRRFDYAHVMHTTHLFCVDTLSATYLDAIKDRMYCDGKDWPSRQSGQVASHYVLRRLTKLLSPILVHTAEEIYARIPGIDHVATVHAETLSEPDTLPFDEHLERRFQAVFSYRDRAYARFEHWKLTSGVKDPQDVIAVLPGDDHETFALLKSFDMHELANLMKFSWVELHDSGTEFGFKESTFEKCERSRVRRPDVEIVTMRNVETGEDEQVKLSARDRRALGI
jgi:isoleucyl-tRNA synthetase